MDEDLNLKRLRIESSDLELKITDLENKIKTIDNLDYRRLSLENQDEGIAQVVLRRELQGNLSKLMDEKNSIDFAIRQILEERELVEEQEKASLLLARQLSDDSGHVNKSEEQGENEILDEIEALAAEEEEKRKIRSNSKAKLFDQLVAKQKVEPVPVYMAIDEEFFDEKKKRDEEEEEKKSIELALKIAKEEEEQAKREAKKRDEAERKSLLAIEEMNGKKNQKNDGGDFDVESHNAVQGKNDWSAWGWGNVVQIGDYLVDMNVLKKEELPQGKIMKFGTIRENVDGEIYIRYRPIFTYLTILINLILFLWSLGKGDWKFESFNVNPTLGPSFQVLVDCGAKVTSLIVAGDWWRLIAPMYLHSGFLHLGMNMLMLYRLGGSIEETYGFMTMAFIYFVSGVSGVLASCAFNPNIAGVGASGALYGLIGALFGDFLQNHKTITKGKWSYFAQMFVSLIIGILIGLLPMIDNWAHLGGLICGFLLANISLTHDIRDYDGKRILIPRYSKILTVISAILVLLWIIVMFSLLYSNSNANQACTWCKYLDCVDTQWWSCAAYQT
jgi:membrane associated rhomboid family serine protease